MLHQPTIKPDLNLCDREPIRVPGAIQPHGLLLVADARTHLVEGIAGEVETRLTPKWQGQTVEALIGQRIDHLDFNDGIVVILEPVIGHHETFDVAVHRSGNWLLVEFEPAEGLGKGALAMLATLETASERFEQSIELDDLCREAAKVYRQITGFDRVMIYRFLEDDAGVVIAESDAEGVGSFMNHHFPAADIPRQARDLYIRNRIRVIPDITYVPAPLRPAEAGLEDLDLSDASLRSVSPIHLQYLRNMNVAASASVSIVQDGTLWGLIACHNRTPRSLSLPTRVACRALAGGLSRQIRAKDDAVLSRERIRLRSREDAVCAKLANDTTLTGFLRTHADELQALLNASGFAIIQGGNTFTYGHGPNATALRELALFAKPDFPQTPVSTNNLSKDLPTAAQYSSTASGLLAITILTEVPTTLLWLRAEKLEEVKWAGNPHKDVADDPQAILTPRSSFEDWTEMVRGRSRPWSLAELETAERLGKRLRDAWGTQRLRSLNAELEVTIYENKALIRQKDFLIKEVSHRTQNSLQLVTTFLRMQAKEAAGSEAVTHLAAAQRRINAVALVHRRLYSDASVEVVDLGRYLEELVTELTGSLEESWTDHVRFDLVPILISADRAVHVGLILTELVINASKYAYGGRPGPLMISLSQHHNRFRLVVSDQGEGKSDAIRGTGFGSRMLDAIMAQLGGTVESVDNGPGLRATVSAPVEAEQR